MAIRRSRIWLSAAAIVAALFVAYVVTQSLAPNEFAGVVSIEQSSDYKNPELIARAWALPVAAAYHAAKYDFQRNESFCGPTSLVDMLHSLGKPQATQATILDGTAVTTIFGHLPIGLTLDDEADLVRKKTGMPVTIERDFNLASLRAELPRTNDPAFRYIVNFSRGPLFAHGHGHHSPILGYLADKDLVFIGDVNGDYGGPWLVKVDRLFQAIDTVDTANGKKRGLLVVEVGAAAQP